VTITVREKLKEKTEVSFMKIIIFIKDTSVFSFNFSLTVIVTKYFYNPIKIRIRKLNTFHHNNTSIFLALL